MRGAMTFPLVKTVSRLPSMKSQPLAAAGAVHNVLETMAEVAGAGRVLQPLQVLPMVVAVRMAKVITAAMARPRSMVRVAVVLAL